MLVYPFNWLVQSCLVGVNKKLILKRKEGMPFKDLGSSARDQKPFLNEGHAI